MICSLYYIKIKTISLTALCEIRMFKFGFSTEDDEVEVKTKTVKHWYNAEQVYPEQEDYDFESASVNTFVCDDIILKYVSPNKIIDKIKQCTESSNCILRAESNHSDLIPAEYEGGLKIWECTKDLINYFSKNKIKFSNEIVLDLGCGAGLLGIYALLNGSCVDFQDYNKEVIKYTTIPNVALNLNNHPELINARKKFFAGDWKHFIALNTVKYDYILTCETIYNPENYEKLLDVFSNNLKENGEIYLAAKTYYFGVGGNIREFEDMLTKRELFHSTTCWTNSEGVQREILKIQKK